MLINRPKKFRFVKSLLGLILVFAACDLFVNIDNLFDPENPDYLPPQTAIISGPGEGEVLDTNTVTFSWRHADSTYWADTSGSSNVPSRIEYSYRLTGLDWSSWESGESLWYLPYEHWSYEDSTGLHSVTLGPLEDGLQLFEVRMKYPTEIFEYNWPMRSFTISAMEGPALYVSPMQTYIDSGDAFSSLVRVLDAQDLMGIHLKLDYDPSFVRLREYSLYSDTTDFLLQSLADHLEDFMFIENDTTAGKFDLSIGLAGGNFTGVSGTGTLIELVFDHVGSRGNSVIQILPESTLRDVNNNTTLNEIGDGYVTVW